MAVRRSVIETRLSPSYRVFWLHGRTDDHLADLSASGREADATQVGFAGSAVAVGTVIDSGSVGLTVEVWNRQPVLLDEKPFDYVVEGRAALSDGRWCVDESHDATVRASIDLPDGAGSYGVRVTAYGRTRVAEILDDPGVEFGARMEAVRALPADEGERYRIQLWPVG